MFSKYILSIFSILAFSIQINGQNDPTFDEFVGTVYKIPAKQVGTYYGEHIKNFEIVGEVRLPELNIPQRQDTIKIPGVELTKGFGIIFKSTMHIPVTGKYGFILDSDDGSLFWINKKEVVNNDGSHKMTKKGAAITIRKGDYPITIWYQQAYPFLYGLIFSSKFISSDIGESVPAFSPEGGIVFTENELYFPFGSYKFQAEGLLVLEKLATELNLENFNKIQITGHTDNVGNESNNLLLSQKRAEAVADFLKEKITKKGIEFSVSGKGETMPVAPNDTAEGRSKNRRVEFKIE